MCWSDAVGGTPHDAAGATGDPYPDEGLATNERIVRPQEQLPVSGIVSLLASTVAIVVVVLFFATSSDSGSLVVDILTNGGDPNPRWQQRLFWAVMEGVIAAVLLAAGAANGADALSALQTASILAGLPFCLVLIAMAVGLVKGLSTERFVVRMPDEASPMPGLRAAARRPGTETDGDGRHVRTTDGQAEFGESADGSGLDGEDRLDPSLGETAVAELSQSASVSNGRE